MVLDLPETTSGWLGSGASMYAEGRGEGVEGGDVCVARGMMCIGASFRVSGGV